MSRGVPEGGESRTAGEGGILRDPPGSCNPVGLNRAAVWRPVHRSRISGTRRDCSPGDLTHAGVLRSEHPCAHRLEEPAPS